MVHEQISLLEREVRLYVKLPDGKIEQNFPIDYQLAISYFKAMHPVRQNLGRGYVLNYLINYLVKEYGYKRMTI